jgi:hypothetical protein
MSKFRKFILNPWTVTVGGGLLISIILKLIDLVSGLNIIGFLNQEVKIPLWTTLIIFLFGDLVSYSIYALKNRRMMKQSPETIRRIFKELKINSVAKSVRIPAKFELTQLNNDLLECTVFIKSKWKPDELEPGIEEFQIIWN